MFKISSWILSRGGKVHFIIVLHMSCSSDRLGMYCIKKKIECPWMELPVYPALSQDMPHWQRGAFIFECIYWACVMLFLMFPSTSWSCVFANTISPFHLYNTMSVITYLKLCCGIVYQSTWHVPTAVLCVELKLYPPRNDDAEDYRSWPLWIKKLLYWYSGENG
jgi:hypothetical protein